MNRVSAFLERRMALYQATQSQAYIDDLNPDAISAYDAKVSDIPASILRTPEEVGAIRQARAQEEAMQMQMMQMQQMAQMQQQQQSEEI